MWRSAQDAEDPQIVAMSLALYREDPGESVAAAQVTRTLHALRAHPLRGRVVVAEVSGKVVAYALLIAFWSNEFGGEICTIDELYVEPGHRGRGISSALFDALPNDRALWPTKPVAIELEVTPDNTRARALYERLGFRAKNHVMRKRLQAHSAP